MRKSEKIEIIKNASENVKIVNAYFRFNAYHSNLIPLALNDKLFLAIIEDDFIFNGYGIYRFKDITKVKMKNDKCDEILKSEGLTSKIIIPDMNISN